MRDQAFPIHEAAQVLRQAGLLTGLHLAASGEFLSSSQISAWPADDLGSFREASLDSRRLADGQLFVALAGEKVDGRRFAAEVASRGHWVLTRPLAEDEKLAANGRGGGFLLASDPEAALTLLAATWRQKFDCPVVGVTGSNGKTTTKDFLAAVLSAAGPVCFTRGNLNNRLGLPLTLLTLNAHHRFAVIEMGASARGHISHLAGLARPSVALITNAAPAHLEEFGSLDNIIQGKGEILDGLPGDGRAILNTDSPGFQRWLDRAPCPVVSYGTSSGDFLWDWTAQGPGGGPEVILNGEYWPVALPGRHNGANLVAAILAARALGLAENTIRDGLQKFSPSAHRSAVHFLAGRALLDDAYNANPESMVAGITGLKNLPGAGRTLAVLGHMAELGPESAGLHRQTGERFRQQEVDILVAVGPLAQPLAEGFSGAGGMAVELQDVAEAARWLQDHTRPGDRIMVKGSRSAALDLLVDDLRKIWNETDDGP